MPIRFRCHNCGQKIRVGDDKAGHRAKCPRCKTLVIVPETTEPSEEPATGSSAEPAAAGAKSQHEDRSALPEIIVSDDHIEWPYDQPAETEHRESVVDYDKIAVPRRVVYLQGVLLAIVALLAFILGVLVGSRPSDQPSNDVRRSVVLAGQVTYSVDGNPRADEGSVVIVLPSDRRPPPGTKAAVEGLRPGDPEPIESNASLRLIRSLGGEYVRTDSGGNFRLRVPSTGRYYVLVISSHAQRSSREELEKADVAQVGRYFQGAVDLLSEHKYRWAEVLLRNDRSLEIQF